MITFPSLAGIPAALTLPASDSLAARCALVIAPPGPIAPQRVRGGMPEHAVLIRQMNAWLDKAASSLQIIRPALHLTLGAAISCECTREATHDVVSVWIGNANGSAWDTRWTLERRWKALEREVPGLAQTALAVLEHVQYAAAAPIVTPMKTLGMAQWTYWMCESNETTILAEYADTEEAMAQEGDGEPISNDRLAEQLGIPTRKQIDKALPIAASCARRIVPVGELERLARRKTPAGAVAAATLACLNAKGRKEKYTLHCEQDDHWAIGHAATIRWSHRDPTGRIFDDYVNRISEGCGSMEEFWGWFVLKGPDALPALMQQLERQFRAMRAMEALLALIADRSRE